MRLGDNFFVFHWFLRLTQHFSRKEVYDLLKSALPKFQPPAEPPKIEPLGKLDDKNRYVVEPPEGSLVVNTMMTHLSGHGRGTHPWFDKLLPETVAVDRLWIRKEEQQALAAGTFPESLTKRLARWHFVDSITFDQNRAGTVKSFEVELDNGRITGSMHLDGSTQKMKLNLLGFVESQNGTVKRFDIVARGMRVGKDGTKYPVAYAFGIADKDHVAFHVPPYPVLGYSTSVYFNN